MPSRTPPDPRHGPPAKRFGRREAVKALGVALSGIAAPLARGASVAAAAVDAEATPTAASFRPLATGGVPKALTRPELSTLEELAELILPATDTPGARAAGVHWYLDDVAHAEPKTRELLKSGLAQLDQRAQAAFGKPFAAATDEERTRIVSALAEQDDAFFSFARSRVVDAYYKSEAGQLGELEWVGHEFYDAFPGACTHPDPASHPRPRVAPRRGGRGGSR